MMTESHSVDFSIGECWTPSSQIAAFTAIMLYKEFMLDGGYYPKGGIQALPDGLAVKFRELGGALLLSDLVEKVHVQGNSSWHYYKEKRFCSLQVCCFQH